MSSQPYKSMATILGITIGTAVLGGYVLDKATTPAPAVPSHPTVVIQPEPMVSGASALGKGWQTQLAAEKGQSVDQLAVQAMRTGLPPALGLDVPMSVEMRDKLANTLNATREARKVLDGHPSATAAQAAGNRIMGKLDDPHPEVFAQNTEHYGSYDMGDCTETMVHSPIWGDFPQRNCTYRLGHKPGGMPPN